jgi:hypothetical protein
MKLDRNIKSNNGEGKYALLLLRKVRAFPKSSIAAKEAHECIMRLCEIGVLDFGRKPETEFFVVRLKDEHALPALRAYANDAEEDDFEYATEVRGLASRSGKYSAFCKKPD